MTSYLLLNQVEIERTIKLGYTYIHSCMVACAQCVTAFLLLSAIRDVCQLLRMHCVVHPLSML